MYLLDTMVLSELRKSRRDPSLVSWLEYVRPTDVYLSVVTIGEVEKGIAKQQRRDPAFAQRLADWLDEVLRYYATRILAIDVSVARRWGRLADSYGQAGADLLIAATAIEHGLAVVTRNVRHFEGTGVPLVNPFRR
ncbi:MAG: type II toxin-antitoxin system VapC family toxin [Geminicoccaceae bacterium]